MTNANENKPTITSNIFDFIPGDTTNYDKDEVIAFRECDGYMEIRDTDTGNTITVSRPKREYNFDADDSASRYVVAPGYINASSFTLGEQRASKRTTEKVLRDVLVYQRMLAVAIHTLNRYNEVIATWPDYGVPNAAMVAHQQMERADSLSRQLKPYADAARAKEEMKRSKAKGGK